MTCIVGLVDGATVWIGGDSAGVSGLDMTVRADVKVFRNGPMLFGFTSSFRMGQLLRYALEIPTHHADVDVDRYMTTTFISAVRECLKTNGFAERHHEAESGGVFLVGYRGRLFYIGSDYQVGAPLDGYQSVGCGDQVAHGALHVTASVAPAERVRLALEAAERWSAGVRRPFYIESLEASS